jgi:hypothetical protein
MRQRGSGQALITLNIRTTPLPAAPPLFATGLGALGLLLWRRKRTGQRAADITALEAST